MRYRMLGLDLDGTLLTRAGTVTDANRAALAAARQAGILVVPCTGRAWRESRLVLAQLDGLLELGVFAGGAAVSEIANGRTLDIAVIEPHLAMEIVQSLFDLPEAVLVFRDANLVGHDYLITGKGTLSANTEWWFQATGANVHFQRELTLDDLHHAMRVGIVTGERRMREVTQDLRQRFNGRVVLQSFEAVQMPDPAESVHVLEVFAWGVDKWRGLKWIAEQRRIDPSQVAVIGDEVNDVAMIESAGCGIAMGNAIEPLKAIADYVTHDCNHSGVAHAITQLLAGEWG